ncbi:hypothetical protein ESZ50_00955 [Weissella muntiaci]|uniref:Uncharacterized protein n=1 Tax=Weissella muntiaci TaxID=2508881 RepID=A0A6C2CA34_9LACO|nr:hypothetical protein [Weissella muntiaci]TYC50817.1 hypothetical protein ESZ50_00955 [Weissella muntiaci]
MSIWAQYGWSCVTVGNLFGIFTIIFAAEYPDLSYALSTLSMMFFFIFLGCFFFLIKIFKLNSEIAQFKEVDR